MKVARPIALIVLAILMMASCRTDSQSAGLDPDPTAVVALRITPASVQLAPADTLRSDWFISGTADARWNDGEINTVESRRGTVWSAGLRDSG